MTETVSPATEAKGKRRARRTGAAATLRIDNINIYKVVIAVLSLAVAAGLAGSIDGLLHGAAWAMPPYLQWTVPAAVDIFLPGAAIATLALRERRAYVAAAACAFITVGLVTFSATANWLYVHSTTDPGTAAHAYGPWIKAAMPVLTLLALEIIAAVVSTRNNKINSPLNREKAKTKRLQAELRGLKAQGKQEAKARRRGGDSTEISATDLHGTALVPAGVDSTGLIHFGTVPAAAAEPIEATR